MFKIVVVVLFSLVLCVDFLREVNRKNPNAAEVLVRAFMIVVFGFIVKGM